MISALPRLRLIWLLLAGLLCATTGSFAAIGGYDAAKCDFLAANSAASAPVGRIGGSVKVGDETVGTLGGEMIVKPGTNLPATIGERSYSGHALDQMQGRGFVPSVVDNTINNGVIYPTRAGTTGYFDAVNQVRVIVNSQSGKVITVIPGSP